MNILWWRKPASDAAPSTGDLRDERLSAYLDGDLAPTSAAELEAEMERDPELTAALDGMRRVRDGLATLRDVRAPRSFALAAAPSRTARWRSFEWALRGGTVAMTAAFAIAVTIDANESAPRAVIVEQGAPSDERPAAGAPATGDTAAPAEDAAPAPTALAIAPGAAAGGATDVGDDTAAEAGRAAEPTSVVLVIADDDDGTSVARVAVFASGIVTAVLAAATFVQWRASRRRRA